MSPRDNVNKSYENHQIRIFVYYLQKTNTGKLAFAIFSGFWGCHITIQKLKSDGTPAFLIRKNTKLWKFPCDMVLCFMFFVADVLPIPSTEIRMMEQPPISKLQPLRLIHVLKNLALQKTCFLCFLY